MNFGVGVSRIMTATFVLNLTPTDGCGVLNWRRGLALGKAPIWRLRPSGCDSLIQRDG